MPIAMLVPAGVGKGGSPIGTRDWADYVRLHSHAVVDEAIERPAEFKKIHDFIVEHRAWTLMNKPDGSFFTTIEEFSAHRRPWGWSRPYDELRPFLAVAAGKLKIETPAGPVTADGGKVLALATAPVSEQGRRSDLSGAGHRIGVPIERSADGAGARLSSTSPPAEGKSKNGVACCDQIPDRRTSPPEEGKSKHKPAHATSERIQAILRAPVEAQSLYKAGLLSEKVAAKLGPKPSAKRPITPEKAAQVREAVNAAEVVVREQGAPKDERSKRALKQSVDAEVRRVLGDAPKARGVGDLRRATLALGQEERATFALWLVDQLEAEDRARVAAHAAASTSELPPAAGAGHGDPIADAAERKS